MKTRTRTTIEHMRPSVARALTPASCSVVGQSVCRARGYLMTDIYPPQPKKRVRASKFARSVTIWDYYGRRPVPFALRALAFLLIVALNAFTLGNVGTTAAYYLDGETLKENSYVAGSVDFILSSTPYSPLEVANNLISGAVATRTVSVIPELGSNSFWYHASSTNFGTDIDFCESLTLASSLEGVQNYSGLLTNFTSPATTTLTSWQFDISTTNSALYNKVCTFDVEFTAWQERHNVPGFIEMGYYDIEKETNKIASQGLRLNKVYYDVFEGSTPSPCGENPLGFVETTTTSCTSTTLSTSTPRGSEVLNEWVEVYNQTNVEQDISGWSICDNTSCDVIPGTATIPPFGYAIITPSSSTLALWNIPVSFPHAILSDGTIGSGLDNDNDMLILKRPDGVIMDQMNYGQSPNIGWANYNDGVWIPGAVDVPEGDALARNPNGYDTDQPSDWVGFSAPTVTLINPSSSSGGTWDFGAPHDVFWSATNPNGSNTDLLIDIYLIKDEDGSRTVTSADTVIPVVLGTNNDGNYFMEASSGFSGYFWVKVVATGSENPLLNDADYSGKLFGSSSCKTSTSKSGCTNGEDDKDDSDDKDDDDEGDHGDDRDDKKHHYDGEEHARSTKDSSKHKDEHEDSHKNLSKSLEEHDDEDNDERETSSERDNETTLVVGETSPVVLEEKVVSPASEKLPDVEIIETTPESAETILTVNVYKKEEEIVAIVKEDTPQRDDPSSSPALDPAPVSVPEPEVVDESVVIAE